MKTEQDYQRVYAGINLDAVMHNLEKMRTLIKDDTKIIAVIKTDGYGHEKNRKSPVSLGICSGNTAGGNDFKKTWTDKADPDLRPQL